MNSEWMPTRKELLVSFGVLAASLGFMLFIDLTGSSQSSLAAAAITGLALWLGLHLFVFLPLKYIPILTRRTDDLGLSKGNAERGAKIFRSMLAAYLTIFLCLQVIAATQPDSKYLSWRIVGGIIFLWLLWGVARGIRPPRHFVAYLLILGVVFLYRVPDMLAASLLQRLLAIELVVGVGLGLVLVLSKDVGAFLSERYAKLPPNVRERIERKSSQSLD